MRRFQVISLAQASGILAASVMKLPLCSRVTGDGASVLVDQCEKKQLIVTARETKCGFQPLVIHNNQNFTIGLDGWSIHPFSPCFWPKNLVNFNGKTYHWEFTNGSADWVEQLPTLHTPNLKLISEFDELPLNDFDYAAKRHPAHLISEYERLNVINEVMGLTRETHDNALSGITMSEKQDDRFSQLFSWTDYLKIIVFSTIGIILFILVVYLFAKVNPIPALIDSFQRRSINRPERDIEDMHLEQFQPMLGSQNHPVVIQGNAYPFIVQPNEPRASDSFLNRIDL